MVVEETYISPKVQIKSSLISGKGMFAKEDIFKGEVIIKWGGIFFTKKEIENINAKDYLIIQIDDDLYSVEKNGKFEDDYYINHSCDSNLWMNDSRTFIARKSIKKAEEVTVDYSLFEAENYVAKWKCNCGSSFCRKNITGKDYQIEEVQQRYKNHFSPLINKRIK